MTHPLLDWCTSYGTELLSPFSRQRFALDAIPIIDPAFTLLLAVTLAICWALRRRSNAKAARADMAGTPLPRRAGAPRATALVAALGLLLACAYIAAGRLLEVRKDGRPPAGDTWQMMRDAWADLWRP